jgi:hypothetical protein
MDTIESFFSYFSSPHSCSPRPPRTLSPPSEEPTTSFEIISFGGNNPNTGCENNTKKVEYRKFSQNLQDPHDPQDPSLLFRFMVYASGGTLPSEVKKVTRETPQRQEENFNQSSSKQITQYSWVVRHHKRRRRSKGPLEHEILQASTGDVATHEDAHEEDTHEEDVNEEDANEEVLCEKSVQENYSRKSVTFDIPANPPRKSALKATLRDSAPAPKSWRSRFSLRPKFRLY